MRKFRWGRVQSHTVCIRKGFLIYEEMSKYLTKYEDALVIYDFATDPFWISLYMRKMLLYFSSVHCSRGEVSATKKEVEKNRVLWAVLTAVLTIWANSDDRKKRGLLYLLLFSCVDSSVAEDPVLPQLPPGLQGRRRQQELWLPLERYQRE